MTPVLEFNKDVVDARIKANAPRIAADARKEASKLGGDLVKQFNKESGVGQGVGRSGGGGDAYGRAGAELIRRGNLTKDTVLREALKTEGQRLIEYPKSISHK